MFGREETCSVCGRSEPMKAVITDTHHFPVCECHVGDLLGDMDEHTEVIPNF